MKIKLLLPITNYRVLETITGDGKSTFQPQMKILFLVWRSIRDPGYNDRRTYKFYELEHANKFLADRQTDINSDEIVKTIKHPFNLVFHKLKQSE